MYAVTARSRGWRQDRTSATADARLPSDLLERASHSYLRNISSPGQRISAMGGRAFAQKIPRAVFPRLNSAAYDAQKRAILPRIQALYRLATVPAEAPGKCDHGDLDILVAHPIHGDETLGMVGAAIGAKDCILQPGNRTSNFAVPLQLAASPLAGDDSLTHFQVDVHVCDNQGEYERILFHHSYGDVGLIVGVIASGVGLHFGTKGLRVSAWLLLRFPCN
jgi:hypothetical protein